MKKFGLMLGVCIVIVCGAAGAADRPIKSIKRDSGKTEYIEHCAVCHGTDGAGSGAYVEFLKKTPADLTSLSRKNGGVFPFERAFAVIDGREALKAHGERDMPIWGQRYSQETMQAAEYFVDSPYDMEMYVRARILALVDYLNRIQKK